MSDPGAKDREGDGNRPRKSPPRSDRELRKDTGGRTSHGPAASEAVANAIGPRTPAPEAKHRRFPREEVETLTREILGAAGERLSNQDLLNQILLSASRLAWENTSRLNLKIVGSALRELRASFRLFDPFRPVRKVCVFGSARTDPHAPLYALAERTGAELVRAGMMVITGAGPGVMEAANKGAGPASGFGLNIRLPFEPDANPYIRRPDRLINFKYFFTRKLVFIKESDAFIFLPGGFGTNDECFELLTLLQNGKGDPRPVVLLDVPGGTYWDTWLDFLRRELIDPGYIDPDDERMLALVRTPEEAIGEIHRFYRIYHSSRYVGDRLILRLEKPLTAGQLRSLAEEFSEIIVQGTLEPCAVLAEDRNDPSLSRLFNIRFEFDRRRFSRLRLMIDAINRM